MKLHNNFICLLVLVVAGSLGANRAAAMPTGDPLLDKGLQRMAQAIKTFLEEEKLPLEMVVGTFQSKQPRLRISGGTEIGRSLRRQLELVGIKVKADAQLQLMGDFEVGGEIQFAGEKFESAALKIEAIILDGDDEELAVLPITLFGPVALQIAGANLDLPPNRGEKERQTQALEQLRKPATVVDKSVTRSSGTSPFGIEILVNNGEHLTSRAPRVDQSGKSFVQLNQTEEYVVRIRNQANYEVAVDLTIDGVSVFALAEDQEERKSKMVLRPQSHVDVPGWFISRSNSKAFEISGYTGSVADKFHVTADVGTITAVFRGSWIPGEARPADEASGIPKGAKATRAGRDVNKNYTSVTRDIGVIRAIVSVRYDR